MDDALALTAVDSTADMSSVVLILVVMDDALTPRLLYA